MNRPENIFEHGNMFGDGPIHIERVGNRKKEKENDDVFEEENFLGPELNTRKIVLRKRRGNSHFPMMLGPFPINLDMMPMVDIKALNGKDSKEKQKGNPFESLFMQKKEKVAAENAVKNKKQDKMNKSMDMLDKQLERGLDEFLFGHIPHEVQKHVTTVNNKTELKAIEHKKDIDDGLPAFIDITNSNASKNGPAGILDFINHMNHIVHEPNITVKKSEIPVKPVSTAHIAHETPITLKKEVVIPHADVKVNINNDKHNETQTDIEKLEKIELSNNNMTGSNSVFSYMMKSINSAESKNLYISLSILMLLVFIIIIILCYYISSKKAERRNNKEARFLADINNNTYF